MGLFSKIKAGLLKTKQQMVSKIARLLHSFTKIDEDLFEQLEETLIMSDVGVETSLEICDRLRKKIKEEGITDPKQIMRLIHEIVAEMMGEDQELDLSTKPSVIMVIGVNGAGKTTTIGKLCHKLKGEGKKVIVAAADTFRAAAIDQLQVWTERAGVDIVKHAEGSDAAAVVYDAITAAKARNCDVVIVDTAGRLHNKKNLMDELAKINRIVSQQAEGCSREILLVLDATTGQNAVNQARLFKEAADITGIVLTKLDGTAKGGIVISIKNELDIPVKLIGLGEKIDDLQDFNSKDFVNALFGDEVLDGEINFDDEVSDDNGESAEESAETGAETAEDITETVAEEAAEEASEAITEPATEASEETVVQAAEEITEPAAEENAEETSEPVCESAEQVTETAAEITEPVAEAVTETSEPAEETAAEITEPVTEEVPEESAEPAAEEITEPAEETEEPASGAAEDTSEPSAETTEAPAEPAAETAEENTESSDDSASEENAEEQNEETPEEPEEGKKKKSFFDFFRRKKK